MSATYLLVGRLFAMTSTQILMVDLEPYAATLLDRHLASAKEWFPHEYVPYARARDFEPGREWTLDDSDLGGSVVPEAVRSALFVNLLTEDNLPYYFQHIERTFGSDGAFGTWVRRWTAEEGRHAIVIRDYLTVTRAIDPVALERGGWCRSPAGRSPSPTHRFAHWCTSACRRWPRASPTATPAGFSVMTLVSA